MADRAVRPTRIKTSHQPTVQQNKPNLGYFSRTSTFTHVGWREHITEYRQTTKTIRHGVYIHNHSVVASVVRRFARPRIPSSSPLSKKRRHSGACKPFQIRLTASHRRPRHRPRTRSGRVPTVKGAFGIQGRHWFDSNASHSAPSTRQDGAHNLQHKQKENNEQQEKRDAEIHTLSRIHRK